MRTTIDLPADLHELVRQIAHDEGRSISDTVAHLMRLGLHRPSAEPARGRRGMPVVSVGRPVTAEDVRTLEDE